MSSFPFIASANSFNVFIASGAESTNAVIASSAYFCASSKTLASAAAKSSLTLTSAAGYVTSLKFSTASTLSANPSAAWLTTSIASFICFLTEPSTSTAPSNLAILASLASILSTNPPSASNLCSTASTSAWAASAASWAAWIASAISPPSALASSKAFILLSCSWSIAGWAATNASLAAILASWSSSTSLALSSSALTASATALATEPSSSAPPFNLAIAAVFSATSAITSPRAPSAFPPIIPSNVSNLSANKPSCSSALSFSVLATPSA